ncbi:MAG: hypothetical protein ABL925_04910 [Methylococcales bacterium]
MKKRKKTEQPAGPVLQNPVAKFAGQFNKAQTFRDQSKYTRNNKHKKQEAWLIILLRVIHQTSCLFNSTTGLIRTFDT